MAAAADPSELFLDFSGTERFEILGRLGAGGMGVVYRAYDRERDAIVALKTLRFVEPGAIFRLKQEFRALADLSHPNLVALHELISAGDRWFFTMELVEGTDLLTWVREGPDAALRDTLRPRAVVPSLRGPADPSAPTERAIAGSDRAAELRLLPSGAATETPGAVSAAPPLSSPEQLERLRAGLRQLVAGVEAVHAAGRLHRDIKPSNVLVARDGRVVLLDFGLAAELVERTTAQVVSEEVIVGTAAYMAPEQARSAPVGPASDWYGVGAVLFEALTGRPPFQGKPIQILLAKQQVDPPPPRALAPGVPPELDGLCAELLDRREGRRPAAPEIRRRLGGEAGTVAGTALAGGERARPFVGRRAELAALAQAWDDVRRTGRAVTAHVIGPSGVGKTALVRRFLEDLRGRAEVTALVGRCHEAESVPYKAFDGVVDALSRLLVRLPRAEVQALLPADVAALARVFPVLRRVEAVAEARAPAGPGPSPQDLRGRAFRAVREVLGRIARRQPLVVWIDDLQWGDRDSALLLAELLRAPDEPPLLFVGSTRSEDADRSPLVEALVRPGAEHASWPADVRPVPVGLLEPREAEDLARHLVGADGDAPDPLAALIAREARGRPDAVIELACHVRERGGELSTGGVCLEDVIAGRIAALPDDARHVLEVVALSGRPVLQAVAGAAAGVRGDLTRAIAPLRAARLVHTRGIRGGDDVECYHDRIRDAALALVPAGARPARHRRLAAALVAAGVTDPEALLVHYRAAGDHAAAVEQAILAAEAATRALAFEHAAGLYRFVVEARPPDPETAHRARTRLGDALANAGRGREAADAYLAAAALAEPGEALDLRRRAAEQLLLCGHFDEGRVLVKQVLAAVGLVVPRSPGGSLVSLALLRLRLRLGGERFRERRPEEAPVELLHRADVCWSATVGLSFIDPLRAAVFQARHEILALRAGEPARVAMALSVRAAYSAAGGMRGAARTRRILARADALARRTEDPVALAAVTMSATLAAFLEGRWRDARRLAAEAEEILRDRCAAGFPVWHRDNAQLVGVWSAAFLGHLGELPRRLSALAHEAEQRGDLHLATRLQTGTAIHGWLAAGDADAAERVVAHAERRGSPRGTHVVNFDHLLARCHIDLHRGDGVGAWRRLEEAWRALYRPSLRIIKVMEVEALDLRGRCALAAAAGEGVAPAERAAGLRVASRAARRLARARADWAIPLAACVRAGVASLTGDAARALEEYGRAVDGFEAQDMALHAAAARWRRAALLGEDAGRADAESARAYLAAEGIRAGERLLGVVAPGR